MNKDVCPKEIDFYVLRTVRNDASRDREEIIRTVKDELDAEYIEIDKSIERVELNVSRFSAVIDPLVNGLIPFYAFINVRENFKAVTDALKKNIKNVSMQERIVGIYDLIGKPDFLIVGLISGAKGKKAEQFIHEMLEEMGGEKIHNYLTIQVEIPRAIKKFWHCRFELSDIDERLQKIREIEYDPRVLKELQKECRYTVRSAEIQMLEDSGIVKGYSVVMDENKYQRDGWNFIKAFIQVDALYNKTDDLCNLLENAYSKDIRGITVIPYNRYGILIECECANIARLRDIMSLIRNCEYVRTTSTAITRDVIREELWVI